MDPSDQLAQETIDCPKSGQVGSKATLKTVFTIGSLPTDMLNEDHGPKTQSEKIIAVNEQITQKSQKILENPQLTPCNTQINQHCFIQFNKNPMQQQISKQNKIEQSTNKIVQNYENAQQFIDFIIKKYQLDEDDKQDFIKYLEENNIKQFLAYAGEQHKQSLKNDIEKYIQFISKGNQNQIKMQLSEEIFNEKFYQFLKNYEVKTTEIEGFITALKQNNVESKILLVKNKKRNNFRQQVRPLIEQYLIFKEGRQNTKQIADNNNQTKIEKLQQRISLKQQRQSKIITKTFLLTIKIGDIFRQINVRNGSTEVLQFLKSNFDIEDITQYDTQFQGKVIQNIDEIFIQNKNKGLLKFIKKIELECDFEDNIFNVWVSERQGQTGIKQSIMRQLKQNQLYHEDESKILLKLISQDNKQIRLSYPQTLKKLYSSKKKIHTVIIQKLLEINVYFGNIEKNYKMVSSNTINDLKNQLEIDFLPKQAQCLQYQRQNSKVIIKEEDENKLITQVVQMPDFIQISLSNASTTQFYGFHENRMLKFNDFNTFIMEGDKELIQVIKNCDMRSVEQERAFFDQFIVYLYTCIKKRFPIQTTIEKVKELVVKNKYQSIWMPSQDNKPQKMNQTFLMMYLLRNSQERLKIQIMNLVKNLMPIPLYINEFEAIFDVNNSQSEIIFNQSIIWMLKKGITICSLGLHTQKINKQKGKSQLLNQIFFTNFCGSQSKHKIVKKIPYIFIRAYDDLFPLNIIDIPSDCDPDIARKLLHFCDIVLLNSWKKQSQTIQYANRLQKEHKCVVINIIRDDKDTSKDILKKLNETNLLQSKIIKIPNFSNFQSNKGSINIFREKINLFLLNCKEKMIGSKKIFGINQNSQFVQFDKIIDNFEKNSTQICNFVGKPTVQLEGKPIKKQKIQNKKLNQNILKLLDLINHKKIPQYIALMYFRQRLRNIQNQNINKYMVLYKVKEKLQKSINKKTQEQKKVLQSCQKLIKPLNQLYENLFANKEIEEALKIIDMLTSDFQNNIKPKIFSIELFWRQIYLFMKINPNFQISNVRLFDLVTNLKSQQIMNNQPFEIIDGDCLQMPKQVMKKVFTSINDNCLVLTIIGPQSSGKSTLLNFLFGCDFATSEGRCTRGVYGTYFRHNNPNNTNFDGIFVIDTEGLFALSNETDEKHQDRQNFDSKLVLFCLAVSDFVIINVRGNLDKNTQKILSICNDKIEALNLSQDDRPQVVIVLNQNSTSKTEESQNEFKKIKKTFDFNLSRSLSLAYSIKNYGQNQICLLAENEILSKKIPFAQFYSETSNLLMQILQKMKKRKTTQKIMAKIQKFAQIWFTVLQFPNLSQMKTKEYTKLDLEIKTWKKNKDEEFDSNMRKIISDYNAEVFDEKSAYSAVQKLNLQIVQAFQKQYEKQALNQQLRMLYQNQMKQISLKNDNNFTKLKSSISECNIQKQMNQQKFQGDGILRQMQKQIIRNQNKKIRQYTQAQKQQIFYKGFDEALDRIKRTMKQSQNYSFQFDKIKSNYQYLINSSRTKFKGFGLPKQKNKFKIQQLTMKPYSNIRDQLIQNIIQKNIAEANSLMQYHDVPYTNILKGSQSDAKLKYLNVKDYFKKVKTIKKFYLSKENLVQHFFANQFSIQVLQTRRLFKQRSGQIQLLKKAFENINAYLRKYFLIEISDFQNFWKVYDAKTSNLVKKIYQYIFQADQILSIRKISSNNQVLSPFGCNADKQSKYLIAYMHSLAVSHLHNGSQHFKLKEINYIEGYITENIKWTQIAQYIKNTIKAQQHSNSSLKLEAKKNANHQLCNLINQDLIKFNFYMPENTNIIQIFQKVNLVKFNEYQKYNSIEKQKQILNTSQQLIDNIQIINNKLVINDQNQIKRFFHGLRYFNGRKLYQNTQTDIYNSKDLYNFANFQYQQLIHQNKQFQGYKEPSREITARFKSSDFKQFIFKEIKVNKKSLEKFTNQIIKIVQNTNKKWGISDSRSILQTFSLINEQISQFNNDLYQISHELSPSFIGQIHLLAIYLIWKLNADEKAKKLNQPYVKKLANRDNQLRKFISRTSNDVNKIVQQQVEAFTESFADQFQKKIKGMKQALFQKRKKQFNHSVSREEILRQVDFSIFSKDSDPEIILQYLEKPYDILSAKYQQNYDQNWKQMSREFRNLKLGEQFYAQFEQTLSQFKQGIQNIDKIVQEKANPSDIFQMVTKNSEMVDYDQEAKKLLFNFFFEKLLHENYLKQRKCHDIILKPRNKLTQTIKPKKQLKQILSKIDISKLKITNLFKFLNILLLKPATERLKLKLIGMCQFVQQQQRNFISQIRVIVCKQKCPCCGRICGVQQQNHAFHKCVYGHQMRALAGNYILNEGRKEAYVARCDNLKQTDIMQYNGNKFTWTQFKDYWSKKPTGGWLYDDLKNYIRQNDRRRFENAWILAGPLYCKKHGIQYVDYNDAKRQRQLTINKVHFIFALDESGSMKGKKWKQLMDALEQTIKKIQIHSQKGTQAHISIVNFSSTSYVTYERSKPSEINVRRIPFDGGGTNFQNAFEATSRIANRYIHEETIVFVFMTDGEAQYPKKGIQTIKNLMSTYPKMFFYSGIEFGCNSNVMKLISTALKGKHMIANNFDELLNAYSSCVEFIAYKQEGEGIMDMSA